VAEFIIIVESAADFRTASTIANRLFIEQMPWLEEYSTDLFTWSGLQEKTEFSCWSDIRKIREELKARGIPSPRYLKGTGKSDGATTHIVLQLITQLQRHRDIRAVVFIRDSDNQPERRTRLEQAREEREEQLSATAIVIGIAHTKREAWVLNGFVALDEAEESVLAQLRQQLSFDPTTEAHRLREITRQEPDRMRNVKVVLNLLTQDDGERERHCWQHTSLNLLRERGIHTGLTAYMSEVEEQLVPLLQQI
jgi:hypothetical protein